MSKAIPTIQKFMSYNPQSIDASATIAAAQDLMKQKNIRHLPVVADGKVLGVVSDRDIKLAMSLIGVNPKAFVKDIIQHAVYSVSPQTPLDHVVDEMALKHYGSAIVEDNHKLVGIFTATDALKAVSDILHQRHHD